MKNKKQILRDSMRYQRNVFPVDERHLLSVKICDQLIKWVEKHNSKVVHLFLPMESEPNIYPFIQYLLENNITVVSPKSLKKRTLKHLVLNSLHELETGIYGTKHPKGDTEFNGIFDLIIVPGLAFDKQNNRLGYGAGYYDTFLENQHVAHKLGICFPFQLIESIPLELHDVSLNGVIC